MTWPWARGASPLQAHQILDDLERIRAAVHDVAGLDQDRLAADPAALVIDQPGSARDVAPGREITMQVADGNNSMNGRRPPQPPARPGPGQPPDNHGASKAAANAIPLRFSPAHVVRRRVDVQASARPEWRKSGRHLPCVSRQKWGPVADHAQDHDHPACGEAPARQPRPRASPKTAARPPRIDGSGLAEGRLRWSISSRRSAPCPQGSAIQTPRSIFASNATKQSPSLRAMHTVGPLAATPGYRGQPRLCGRRGGGPCGRRVSPPPRPS